MKRLMERDQALEKTQQLRDVAQARLETAQACELSAWEEHHQEEVDYYDVLLQALEPRPIDRARECWPRCWCEPTEDGWILFPSPDVNKGIFGETEEAAILSALEVL